MITSIYPTPEEAWTVHMEDLLQAPGQRLQQYLLRWEVPYPLAASYMKEETTEPSWEAIEFINSQYETGNFRGCDRDDLTFTQWNMNKIFPLWLWQQHACRLRAMLSDPRFTHPPAHSKTDNWSSIFGRIGTKRSGHRVSFIEYLLERYQMSYMRGQPIYYFDVEGSAYTLEPMVNNPGIIRHKRVSTSCIMAVNFKYESKPECMFVSIMMRSNLWSHTYGDIFGGSYMGIAICRELQIPRLQMSIFMPSSVADEKSQMKALLHMQHVEIKL